MPFSTGQNYNEEKQQSLRQKSKPKFMISNESFYNSSTITSLSISIFLIVLFISKLTYCISETDIQCICQIAAGLSGLTLAIPLFLKDFEVTSNFWKQFFLISITFLIATFIGCFSFLETHNEEPKKIFIYLWFFFSLTISINITTLSRIGKWTIIKYQSNIIFNPLVSFLISCFTLIISLLFANGDFLIYGTILFTIYGLYLTLTLMFSIIIELFKSNNIGEDNDLKLKKAIEILVNKYKSEALDEQNLLDKLKNESFPESPQIVSRSKVQNLITEMILETDLDKPKIDIYNYDYIIPRWKNDFTKTVIDSNPKIIFLDCESDNYQHNDLQNLIDQDHFLKKYGDKLYSILSNNTGLSVELLKENYPLKNKYKVLKFVKLDINLYSQWSQNHHYLFLVDLKYDINRIFSSNHYEYYESDYFTQEEYETISIKNNLGEVLFENSLSIEDIENSIE